MDEPNIHIDYKTLVDVCDKGGVELFNMQAYFAKRLSGAEEVSSWMVEHIMDLTMADRVKYMACMAQSVEVGEEIMKKYQGA